MKIKAFVIVDTNVLISAMYSRDTPPYEILKMIDDGNIIPLYDKRILKEYYDVFKYPKFRKNFSDDLLKRTLYSVVENGIMVKDVEITKSDMKDKSDIPFFEVKESTSEFNPMIVTGNMKHYPEDDCIVTPRELINILKQLDRFVQRDISYLKTIDELIEKNLLTTKYSSGKDIVNEMFEENKVFEIKEHFFDELEL